MHFSKRKKEEVYNKKEKIEANRKRTERRRSEKKEKLVLDRRADKHSVVVFTHIYTVHFFK